MLSINLHETARVLVEKQPALHSTEDSAGYLPSEQPRAQESQAWAAWRFSLLTGLDAMWICCPVIK